MIERKWALWRRVQYGTLFSVVLMLCGGGVYFSYFYQTPQCFDGKMNGTERGVDCGGACVRICPFDVITPEVVWANSFRVSGDQYNAVGYIENKNRNAASPQVRYTFTLYDTYNQIITTRTGTTILPPNSSYPVFEARIITAGRVPERTTLTLEPVDLWVPAETGRNQFAVVSRQLTSVDSDPRLTAIIENQALTEANNVEVVATIFDAQGNPLTASRTEVNDFAPQSQEEIIFTWPEPIAKTLRTCDVPTDVVLAIDLSGSMNNDGDTPPEPISSVLSAAEAFANRLRSSDQVGLVTFATNAELDAPLSTSASLVAGEISELSIDPAEERGSTNTGEAIQMAYEELTSIRHNQSARKVLVLLTDGLATAPSVDPELYAQTIATDAKADDIIIYTIGLGNEVNMNFIKSVASSNGHAFQAVSRSQIDQIYKTITSDICEDGPAVIDIVPKSDAGFVSL